jgi:hypothetical protein
MSLPEGKDLKGPFPKGAAPSFFSSPLRITSFPPFPGLLSMLGPGIVWMALAQGSGELIWWPYLIAKYGLGFLFLLIPACLLQYPVNYSIGSYTLLTGETIFQGFMRVNRWLALLLWVLMSVSFLWFGAFASAGGTALAAMTKFPAGWTGQAQTLFWAYLSMGVFFSAILFSRVVYPVIEKVMWAVALLTLVGLLVAASHPDVLATLPRFFKGLILPHSLSRPWEAGDATKLLTAITFAGLGGFWTLFYSYWLRDKGVGMAKRMGRVTSPFTGKEEVIPDAGFTFEGAASEIREVRKWKRFLIFDSGVGIFGNILTTLLTCLLAFALLHPQGILPQGYELAVVQARFFEVSWGAWGRILFLFVAAAFLSDTWFATLDAVSRIQADFFHSFFPPTHQKSFRWWYYFFAGLLTVVTTLTMPLAEPGALILLSAVLGFVGTVIFTVSLLILNLHVLPRLLPREAIPGIGANLLLGVSAFFYLILAGAYCLSLR